MKIEPNLTDDAVLTEVGSRLARRRLDLQLSQAQLAEQAGLSKRTVERIEAGDSTQLVSVVRVLRVLGLLDGLEQLVPVAGPRPLDLLRLRGKMRQRVASSRKTELPDEPWRWDDDK